MVEEAGVLAGYLSVAGGQFARQKMGFEIEGTKRDSLLVDGAYVDEYYMAKLI